MDVTFVTSEGTFNYRVCAVIIHDNHLLAMQDERSPYYYLPGGRVHLGETLESAMHREMREELGFSGLILRPLWLCENFFVEDVNRQHYHELCLYYLLEADAELLARGRRFESTARYLLCAGPATGDPGRGPCAPVVGRACGDG